MSNDDWQESTGLGEVWDYKSGGPGAEIEGVYMGYDDNVGPNGSRMHHLDVPGKGIIDVWGNSILDQRMKNFVPGKEQVKLVYQGLKSSEKTKGRTYHDFKVFHRAITIAYQEQKSEKEIDEFEQEMGIK